MGIERTHAIVSTAYGTSGDVLPMLKIAETFKQIGASKVTVCVNEANGEMTKQYGIDYVTIGDAEKHKRMVESQIRYLDLKKVVKYLISHQEEHLNLLLKLVDDSHKNNLTPLVIGALSPNTKLPFTIF
jgi:UDP:flavonoid glycosyltransferase YjiC (YdhE family)